MLIIQPPPAGSPLPGPHDGAFIHVFYRSIIFNGDTKAVILRVGHYPSDFDSGDPPARPPHYFVSQSRIVTATLAVIKRIQSGILLNVAAEVWGKPECYADEAGGDPEEEGFFGFLQRTGRNVEFEHERMYCRLDTAQPGLVQAIRDYHRHLEQLYKDSHPEIARARRGSVYIPTDDTPEVDDSVIP